MELVTGVVHRLAINLFEIELVDSAGGNLEGRKFSIRGPGTFSYTGKTAKHPVKVITLEEGDYEISFHNTPLDAWSLCTDY